MSWATWLLFTGVPAGCVALRLRCPGPLGSRSPVCPLGVLCCACGVLVHLAPVHRCARSVCCAVCAVSLATWLLFTGVPVRCVVFGVRCPGPLGPCSPVRPFRPLLCLCGVLGHLAPVHRCACSVCCCFACVVFWATWLLFTGVPARCVALRVRCPGPRGSCSPVRPLGCCICGASLRGAHSSIRTAAVHSRQGLGTLRARTRPSGRRLFVAGRGWVPSGRALVHPDGGWCCLKPVRVPWFVVWCARSPGLRHPAAVVAWHLSVCLGCGRRRASLACLVAPRGAPRLVRSGRSRCSDRFSRRRGACPHPGGLRPRLYWVGARGTRRPAENRAHCACRGPPPRQGRGARSASYPFGAPRWGCPWRVPLASVLGCVRCGGWRVWTRSLTRLVSRTVRRSTGDWAGAPGLFRVDADTSPAGRRTPRPGPVLVCVCSSFVARSGGPASQARFGAPQLFPVAALSFCFARPPPGWGCPFLGLFFFFCSFLRAPFVSCFFWFPAPGALGLGALFSFPPPRPVFFFLFLFFLSFAPPLSLAFFGFRPRVPWALAPCVVCSVGLLLLGSPCALASLVSLARPLAAPWWLPPPPPLPFCVSRFLSPPGALGFFFSFLLPFPFCASDVSGFLWFPAPGAAGLGAVCCLFCWPPASRLSVLFHGTCGA